MKLPIKYSVAVSKYNKQMKEIEAKIRKGTSKHKNDPLNLFIWYIDFAVQINDTSTFQDIFSGKRMETQQKFDAMPVEKKIKERMKGVNAFLSAEKGRGYWVSATSVGKPTEIEDYYREEFKTDAAERARVASLSSEENQKEIDDLLKELQGPGFFKIDL